MNQTVLNKYSEAIRLKPNFAAAYRFRGDRCDALGKKAEAKRDWAKAEELEKAGSGKCLLAIVNGRYCIRTCCKNPRRHDQRNSPEAH